MKASEGNVSASERRHCSNDERLEFQGVLLVSIQDVA